MNRTQTKQIHVGSVAIGGGAPVAVQSMCNTRTSDARATIEQIARLHDAGCEIIRLAVPDQAAADALPEIVHASPIPVVADIHFDYRLALAAAKAGVHKIRINPGNIGEPDNVRKVAEACRERGIPIRIGVNGGSLEKRLLEKYGHPTPEALVESAQGHIDLLHRYDFDDITLSMKSSTVPLTIAAYRLAAERFPYPLHVGVTETGTAYNGIIRSAVGIGTLLSTITVNTRGKDVMLAVLFVPLIFPLLYACASATTAVVVGAEGYLDVFTQSMALAGGYDVIMLLVSWVLYDFVISA